MLVNHRGMYCPFRGSLPLLVVTSTWTVGLPLESSRCAAWIAVIILKIRIEASEFCRHESLMLVDDYGGGARNPILQAVPG